MRSGSNFTYIDDSTVKHGGRTFKLYAGPRLKGERHVVERFAKDYPSQLLDIERPPERLYVIGEPDCLRDGLAVIGARKATPYGLACAERFSAIAAQKGVTVISGGAYGCDSRAHRAALDAGGRTVAILGGGCDQVYPSTHFRLFQEIIDAGGAVVSERDWDYPALPFTFRERNRIIAGCSRAVLIVEAGLPSGTFSTADDALDSNREVLVVPGAITSRTSAGSNKLLYQGATPIIDDETFEDVMFSLFGTLRCTPCADGKDPAENSDQLLAALRAQPMRLDDILVAVDAPREHASDPAAWLRTRLVELEAKGVVARFPDGRYGPASL